MKTILYVCFVYVVSAALGALLAYAGFTFRMWQFWLMVVGFGLGLWLTMRAIDRWWARRI